jgi:hypothetical protein
VRFISLKRRKRGTSVALFDGTRRFAGLVGLFLVFSLIAVQPWAGTALGFSGSSGHNSSGHGSGHGDALGSSLERLRYVTGAFHSETLATAAGFEAEPVCVASPDGGMGYHHVNQDRIADGVINKDKPEILLYAGSASSERRLVGVEYFKVDEDQNLATDDDRPTLFGRAFEGPMEGHAPGMPIHYDLHVWVWKKNPAGMFAMFNPKVSCPE